MKIAAILTLLVVLVSSDIKLVKTKVGDDITVNLPSTFYPMSPQDMSQRYPSVRQPIGAYTNEDRLVDFSVNVSATRWRSTDIEIAKDFFKASIVELYDRVDFKTEKIEVVNNMRYIIFEFDSRINGDKYSLDQQDAIRKYSYMMYLLINGKTIVFSFNVPIQIKEKWIDTVPEVMNSIKVKPNI
ncbi:hypothetical protein [Fulvivirga lutea]|uniref:Uncharacterized protein n=1 Tax=Fulvivirga lutea TaxID=2810512 RepID=A0A975A271_9BACT|nr:hypothetical protein [Fulvivirga lutea]QSE98980.1 hypothetical protein JR347_07815 [Fulvivirga lutea]